MARKKRITHCVDPLIIDKNCEVFGDRAEIVGGFARRFNDLLEKRQIDQEKLAEDTGISMSCISSYRNGKSEPKLSNIVLIAKYLGVDCHYLLAGVSSQNRNIAEYTGLSEQSIEILKDYDIEHIKVLNDLLCSKCFWSALDDISSLSLVLPLISNEKKNVNNSADENEKRWFLYALECAIRDARVNYYSAVDSFADCVNEAYGYKQAVQYDDTPLLRRWSDLRDYGLQEK